MNSRGTTFIIDQKAAENPAIKLSVLITTRKKSKKDTTEAAELFASRKMWESWIVFLETHFCRVLALGNRLPF